MCLGENGRFLSCRELANYGVNTNLGRPNVPGLGTFLPLLGVILNFVVCLKAAAFECAVMDKSC